MHMSLMAPTISFDISDYLDFPLCKLSLAIHESSFEDGSKEKPISQESPPTVSVHKHTHTLAHSHSPPTSERPPGQSPSVLLMLPENRQMMNVS